MESLRNHPSHRVPSQMTSNAFVSPSQTCWPHPNSGPEFTANQRDQMPVPALTSPLMPQAATPFAHEYPVDFHNPGYLPPQPNAWRSSMPAGMSLPSSPKPLQQYHHHQVENDPTLGVAYPPSPFASPGQYPFASPGQYPVSFQEPGRPSEAPNTATNTFNTPLVPPYTMLPPAPPIIPGPAHTNTTERPINTRADAEWIRHKDIIRKIYMEENETLASTMKIMKEKYRFVAEPNKFKQKLDEWGFQKNLKPKQSRYIRRNAKRRQIEGKKSVFRIKDEEVPGAKVQRLLKAKQGAGSSETCSTPSDMSCGTPCSESRPLPPWSTSMGRPEQASANASSTFSAKLGPEYDLEDLQRLIQRARDEAEGENHGQARMLFVEALDGYEALAGPCHYSTVEALSSFVSFCESQNSFDDAKDRMLKSLFHHEDELGRYGLSEINLTTAKIGLENTFRLDPEASLIATLTIDEDLIDIYEQQGDLERCERKYLSIISKLEALQSTLKPYNSKIFQYKHFLTYIYRNMCMLIVEQRVSIFPHRPPPLIKAEKLLLDVLESAERSPKVDEEVLCSLELLREHYHKLDEDEKLGFLLHRIANKISVVVNAKGALSPWTVQKKLLALEQGMARSYAKLGNREDAEWWFLRRQGQIEQSLGSDDYEAILNLVDTARFYLDQDAWEDAEPLLRDALRRAENSQAPELRTAKEPESSFKRRIAQCLADKIWEPGCPHCGN